MLFFVCLCMHVCVVCLLLLGVVFLGFFFFGGGAFFLGGGLFGGGLGLSFLIYIYFFLIN